MYVFYNRLFSFFVPLRPLGLIIIISLPIKCGKAAMPWSGKNTAVHEGSKNYNNINLIGLLCPLEMLSTPIHYSVQLPIK